jgi:hypothetical protein
MRVGNKQDDACKDDNTLLCRFTSKVLMRYRYVVTDQYFKTTVSLETFKASASPQSKTDYDVLDYGTIDRNRTAKNDGSVARLLHRRRCSRGKKGSSQGKSASHTLPTVFWSANECSSVVIWFGAVGHRLAACSSLSTRLRGPVIKVTIQCLSSALPLNVNCLPAT